MSRAYGHAKKDSQKSIKYIFCDNQAILRYHDDNNLAGTRIDVYKAPAAIATMEATRALKERSEELDRQGRVPAPKSGQELDMTG
ncbi:MAG TPA: hypothetical protein DD811_04735 [Syntrophomonas sp.]|nr:hypothetical protein [Syntrophomonas sp.]